MNVAAFCVIALSALGAGERGYLLEFSSESCGPCQQVAPVVAKLEREGLPIRSVDVVAEQALAQQYNITSIPAFVLVVDEKEVDRNVGFQSEGQIRQMLARIPQTSRGPGSDQLAVRLGDEAPLPRPDVTEPAEPRDSSLPRANSVTSRDESPRRMWPFPKKPSTVPADIRGNSPDAMPPADVSAQAVSSDPMAASVRIRVITGNSVVKGSGTLIESLAGRSTVLTCSHICRGATADTKVEIDLFRDGQPITILGTIIGTDPDADVGLLSMPTDEAVAFCPVGAASVSPGMGAKVVSIGCGGGSEPTREQLRVTDVNKFSGPDTLICSGIPIQGRSGGGLFNEAGTLVGVCFAADSDIKTKKPSGGVYCGLKPIHALLAKHEMAHLIPSEGGESIAASQQGTAEPSAPEWPASDPKESEAPLAVTEPKSEEDLESKAADLDSPAKEPVRPFVVPPSKTPDVEEFVADDAEIVVLIRGRGENSPSDKVILIHKPSRKFMQFLQGEVSGSEAESTPMTRRDAPQATEAPTNRVVRAKLPTTSLQATGLKAKRELRPYVRSKTK